MNAFTAALKDNKPANLSPILFVFAVVLTSALFFGLTHLNHSDSGEITTSVTMNAMGGEGESDMGGGGGDGGGPSELGRPANGIAKEAPLVPAEGPPAVSGPVGKPAGKKPPGFKAGM